MAAAFDAASAGPVSPLPFGADITAANRPVAVDGSAALIEQGDHREAVFWLMVTFARSQQILDSQGDPDTASRHRPEFARATRELLGVRDVAGLERRADEVRRFLPRLHTLARQIIGGPVAVVSMSESTAARSLLLDAFSRVRDLVRDLTDGLSDDVGCYRPDRAANSISWLIWHLTRVIDHHVADLAEVEQCWPEWRERFGLPFEQNATGYGHGPTEAAAVRAPGEQLGGYFAAVDRLATRYLAGVSDQELARVVDRDGDQSVTVSVRLVSVLSDALQHLGQAAYLRGMAERRNGAWHVPGVAER